MPARLHFSNSLEALADRLIAHLGREENALGSGDPFEAPSIATPASAQRDWLKIRLAEKLGIAANLEFPHLEKLLWQRLAALDRHREAPDRQPARLLDASAFQGLVLAHLREHPPAALRAYLVPESAPDPYDAARRLCRLSGRLAALFREYEYSRVSEGGFQGLTETWSRGKPCFEQYLRRLPKGDSRRAHLEEFHALEAWQMEIYRALFREGDGLRDRWGAATGLYRYTLPQYAAMALQDPLVSGNAATSAERAVHLFGLSNISPFHRDLIRRLADPQILGAGAARFEIYALNPCAEYWEDALTPRENRGAEKYAGWRRADPGERAGGRLDEEELQSEELPTAAEDNALLGMFGKPGRETVRLWNQITDYDFSGYFREPEGTGVLAALRAALLHRSGPLAPEARLPQDASLQVWSAPDRHAEIEAIRAHAAQRLLDDPDLRPEDIAVIPANLEAYLPSIETVFGGDPSQPGAVPYCLPEAGMLRESPLLRGFRALMELGTGPLGRGELLAFLENPAVRRKLRLEAPDLAAFRTFLERSGFREGWDEEHRQSRGEAPGSASTFAAAEERALLGQILHPDDAGLEASGLHAASGLDRDVFSKVLEWMQALRADLLPFRSEAALSFPEWSLRLRRMLSAHFVADPDDPLDGRAEADLLRFLADLEQWGLWDAEPARVSHPLIALLFEDHFADPKAARSSFLQGGIRVGGLAALRGLPFRCVYVAGLNAGDFPAAREAAPLDLRGYRRVLGETDPATRDLYALLEVVASASDRLVLSYVRRDGARDSVRQPSYAVAGLSAYLESDLLATPFRMLELDAEGRPSPGKSEESSREFRDPAPPPRLEAARLRALAGLPEPEALAIANVRAAPPFTPTRTEEAPSDPHSISLRELSEYLRNPADHACFRLFKLYGALDAEESDDAELFLPEWETRDVRGAALRAEWREPGTGEEAADAEWRLRALEGRTPPPPYADLEKERLLAEAAARVRDWIEPLRPSLEKLGLRFAGTLRAGAQGSSPLAPPLLGIPAFRTEGREVSVRLEGLLPFFFRGEAPKDGWGAWIDGAAAEMNAYLFHLCAVACGSPLMRGPGHVFVPAETGVRIFRLPASEASAAARDLEALLEDFSRAPDFDFLPLNLVQDLTKGDPAAFETLRDWPEALERKERENAESAHAPSGYKARVLRAVGPAVPRDAAAKIERRLLPFLCWKKAWEEIEP